MAAVWSSRNMAEVEGKGLDVEKAVWEYLQSIESGNYRKNVERQLLRWCAWLKNSRGKTTIEEVETLDCRKYARVLKKQVRDDEFKASSARTYYAYLRAFLGFCVDEEWIQVNPAAAKRAVDELPEDTGDKNRQFWKPEVRKEFLKFVDKRAEEALDQHEFKSDPVLEAFRDRALVYTLALAGVRGGEVLSDPQDEKRNGITWSDVDLENGTLYVFGKNREYEYAQVPKQAAATLARYRKVQDPPVEEYPVFPTRHRPSVYKSVRNQLQEQGLTEEEANQVVEDAEDVQEVVQEYGLVVPSLSKNGARSILEKLCEEAEISVEGDVLKLHGARRGLGHELYKKGYAELAQSALRHSSIEVTHESYSDIKASETADRVGDVLNED